MLVYLSGPITPKGDHTLAENIDAAVAVFLDLRHKGINALCPHLIALVPQAHEIAYESWMAYDLALIDVCTHVLMLNRWRDSDGARLERIYAQARRKQIVYSVEELCSLI